ncbi:tetratricopeptide repeat protein [uncultured Aquimarina sp.]|uniref:tetratricopeptide repeat protein n=1 Tax=uncultured Aquimarina sp. TaxID=575652 RepID=UPI002617CDFA|nr:tetratricopeptide repeat protein [uncultured Aquimarina sp.]
MFTSRKQEIIALFTILIITSLIYANHFDNPFFFDDTHTISTNESIRSLDNWTDFFTNADTFSSLPANRSYRPMITLMNAIDYNAAGGLKSNVFHYHIFFWYLVLIVLVYVLIKHLYKKSGTKILGIKVVAIFATSWFALHTANAETINYICARSDSFSTLCVVTSLLLYTHPIGKKWHLYLVTMIIGIWTKQTGVIFFPILLIYIILFEEYSIIDHFKINTKEKILRIVKKIAPTAIIGSSLFLFNQFYLTPESTVSTNNFVTKFEYISTQCYVIIHYLGNFILPLKLSADPDIAIIKPWYDTRILLGVLVISGMVFLMIKAALKQKLRPISFGIAWFFIALLPTSINPLFQIANDHRMFFPFIGLFIGIPWTVALLIHKYISSVEKKNYISTYILTFAILLLTAHAYGTIQRNKVWDSKESLWLDVVQKSPNNARGLMNYGLNHMEKGNYDAAIEYFNRAYKIEPNYCLIHINLGIAYSGKKNYSKAEKYFNSALQFNISSPDPEYFYARYLVNQNEYDKAESLLKKALLKSPNHFQSKQLLNSISNKTKESEEEIKTLQEKIKKQPNPDLYIELSLKFYKKGDYQSVISVCKNLLKIDPNNAIAYNNICSAYNQMQKWELGAAACEAALKINPDFKIARNNLKWATNNIKN